jgi:hypothetical protein
MPKQTTPANRELMGSVGTQEEHRLRHTFLNTLLAVRAGKARALLRAIFGEHWTVARTMAAERFRCSDDGTA